ncbi:acylphosphatase [Luteipulveratus sp. YIM 133132]|uniref:acylphosphatase n=1 Tax=Luteipulveratus flavus TaxID=3031728 RepID=UPI0023B0DE9B|nr:acylphosphatase [Luteipulveratus sp. YIM 133132]MDE9367647.1 acylphosphatase [Luteipulveratus sp. YIM 133132]
MSRKVVDVQVSGRVQGVFFRARCRDEARERGVTGWVRNESDGSVAGHFEGEVEAVDALVEWCRDGSPRADVTDVRVTDGTDEHAEGFRAS